MEDKTLTYYWFVIDDDKWLLANVQKELQTLGETNIYALEPSGRTKIEASVWENELSFRQALPAEDEEIVYPDYDYQVTYGQKNSTLYDILKSISTSAPTNPCFIFLIDILFARKSFCGPDLFNFIRHTLDPRRYVVRFLSHLTRYMVSDFLQKEFAGLHLGQERAKTDEKRIKPVTGDKLDEEFFSKAPYRTDGKAILSQHRVDDLKSRFPRQISGWDCFYSYVIYPEGVDFSIEEITNTAGRRTLYLDEHDGIEKLISKKRFFLHRLKYYYGLKTKNPIYGAKNFDVNKNYLKLASELESKVKRPASLTYYYPLYRHELRKWRSWEPKEDDEIVDVLYLSDNSERDAEIEITLEGTPLKKKCLNTSTDENTLLEEISKARPRYLLIDVPENDFSIIYTICRITRRISWFEVHGFSVIFVANDVNNHTLSGLTGIAPQLLIAKSVQMKIEEEMSPIYWHLIEMAYFESGSFITHELSHLSSCPPEERKDRLEEIHQLAKAHDAITQTRYTPKIEALQAGLAYREGENDRNWYIKKNGEIQQVQIGHYLLSEKKYKVTLEIICPDNDPRKKAITGSIQKEMEGFAGREDSKFTIVTEDTEADGRIVLFICHTFQRLAEINREISTKKKESIKPMAFSILYEYGEDILKYDKKIDPSKNLKENIREKIGSRHWLFSYEKRPEGGYVLELDNCYFIFQEFEQHNFLPNRTIAGWLKNKRVDSVDSALTPRDSLQCIWNGPYLEECYNLRFLQDRLLLLQALSTQEKKYPWELYKLYRIKFSKGYLVRKSLFKHELEKIGKNILDIKFKEPVRKAAF